MLFFRILYLKGILLILDDYYYNIVGFNSEVLLLFEVKLLLSNPPFDEEFNIVNYKLLFSIGLLIILFMTSEYYWGISIDCQLY
jgi:hypothetical protein